MTSHFTPDDRKKRSHRHVVRAFTMIEVLVVISIIAVLAGILLVALGKAGESAKKSATIATMEGFAAAAQAFKLEHGVYPGVIPDDILAASADGDGIPIISGMENALLHMMGGYRVLQPEDVGTSVEDEYNNYAGTEIDFGGTGWLLKIGTGSNTEFGSLGDGPYINGKKYDSYYQPGDGELAVTRGQAGAVVVDLPELIDAWGQPIAYVRQNRKTGPLVGDLTDVNNLPQYGLVGANSYLQSTGLGEFGLSQTNDGGNTRSHSLFDFGDDAEDVLTMGLLIEHPSIPDQARGAFMLWSAGADGVFMSRADGVFTPEAPCGEADAAFTLAEVHNSGSAIADEWDDLRIFGGSL